MRFRSKTSIVSDQVIGTRSSGATSIAHCDVSTDPHVELNTPDVNVTTRLHLESTCDSVRASNGCHVGLAGRTPHRRTHHKVQPAQVEGDRGAFFCYAGQSGMNSAFTSRQICERARSRTLLLCPITYSYGWRRETESETSNTIQGNHHFSDYTLGSHSLVELNLKIIRL